MVPSCGLYLGSYKVVPKRNYYVAYGYNGYCIQKRFIVGKFSGHDHHAWFCWPVLLRSRSAGTSSTNIMLVTTQLLVLLLLLLQRQQRLRVTTVVTIYGSTSSTTMICMVPLSSIPSCSFPAARNLDMQPTLAPVQDLRLSQQTTSSKVIIKSKMV